METTNSVYFTLRVKKTKDSIKRLKEILTKHFNGLKPDLPVFPLLADKYR